MRMQHVLDYGWGRPDPYKLKQRHFAGVIRYLCDTPGHPGKKLTGEELARLLDAGLDVGVIWQETDPAMVGGTAAGGDEGKRARAAAEALGVPEGAALYFSADHGTVTVDDAVAYLEEAKKHLGGYRMGLYGSFFVVTGVRERQPGLVDFFWQTLAWSHGHIADRLHLYQSLFGLSFEGAGVDVNDVLQENWGQFNTRV